MEKRKQIGIPWDKNRKLAFEKVAKEILKKKPTKLARQVLEEYLACYLTDEQLIELGMSEFIAVRLSGLLSLAVRRAHQANAITIAGTPVAPAAPNASVTQKLEESHAHNRRTRKAG